MYFFLKIHKKILWDYLKNHLFKKKKEEGREEGRKEGRKEWQTKW
jgi:hypothetical protein